MAAMVRNPLHEALQQAMRTIGPMIEQINAEVDRPCRMFHSGKVWTGPAAKQFDSQLAQFSLRARTSGQAIMDELRQVLSRTPSEVTEQEAASIRRKYRLV
ncbi:hypothetical protein LDL08_26015 [Nonomuraea glycinis]|uniref:Uncharacterized protein n=1 Tax=Nonomuraea glycinis TaxID=2047744 RepID=A0A918E8Q8_9ACTN|nr:hypothetical protein [Nonomuraea glycinis]MCA2179642.1 hypothetical protein [Nonomuraea glycinis]GGP15251.1 hypothetical protein GCM10012278_74250 [Nonomuraea glycinis]